MHRHLPVGYAIPPRHRLRARHPTCQSSELCGTTPGEGAPAAPDPSEGKADPAAADANRALPDGAPRRRRAGEVGEGAEGLAALGFPLVAARGRPRGEERRRVPPVSKPKKKYINATQRVRATRHC